MMANFKFDQRKLSEDMERIRQLGGLSVAEVLSRASRIAVRQAILTTPFPRKGGAQNLGVQKKAQEKRVDRDVRSIFKLLSEIEMPDDRTRAGVARLIRQGKYEEALSFAREAGRRNALGVLDEPTVEAHRSLRFRKRNVRYYILPNNAKGRRARFIKDTQKRVFQMKAGWGRAAIGLKLKVPGSLKRHFPGQGGFRATLTGDKQQIEFENRAKGLGETREPDSILANAMKSAGDRIAKELQVYMASIGRGDFSKVRNKLQRERFTATTVA